LEYKGKITWKECTKNGDANTFIAKAIEAALAS
jgi:hypothetical protein